MKNIFTFLTIFSAAVSSAQLYVAGNPNSYVYVGNQFLYVKQDVNLQNNSHLYLRNGGQLLQGTMAASSNQGQGNLSVFQEGTVDNFEYNYWCSPVGNASAAAGNEPFGVIMLNQPSSVTASAPATILSMSALDGEAANPGLRIAPRWVFKFLSSINYSEWISVGLASTIGVGEGFTMKGTSGDDTSFSEAGIANNPVGADAQRYDFRGKPNDGNIIINVGAAKMTLTGNPYPSAIDLQAFLLDPANNACTGIAYFWEQDKNVNSHLIAAYQGGYGTYAAGTDTYVAADFYAYDGAGTQLADTGTNGANLPRKFSPIGQGFMIEGATDGTVTLNNNFRVFEKEGALSHFERPETSGHGTATPEPSTNYPAIPSVSGFDYTGVSMLPNPQIRFNILLNNQGIRELALTFHPLATDGVDRAMDAKSPGNSNIDGFFAFDGGQYVIGAIDYDVNEKVPLGLKNNVESTFRIRAAQTINFDEADNVYLHDKQTGIYHDIQNADYEFTVPAGGDTSRYEITFVNAVLGVPPISDSAFDVLQDNEAQQLVISNVDLLDLKSCSLYDITGKLVLYKNNLGAEATYRFSTVGFADGIYIVKLIADKGQSFSRKISIFRKIN